MSPCGCSGWPLIRAQGSIRHATLRTVRESVTLHAAACCSCGVESIQYADESVLRGLHSYKYLKWCRYDIIIRMIKPFLPARMFLFISPLQAVY